ncbi:MAG TPA: hypothetical protein VNV43_12440 [Candidatus Acidoferrales bacterium]|nr:hypothetical protein [Candidatus Acidoferrales bacterium]
MMKLIEVIRDLDALDDESTIYAAKPWTEDSEVIVAHEPESGGVPAEVERLSLEYFLEVLIAREFLEGWLGNLDAQPTLQQKCARVIKYAITDA